MQFDAGLFYLVIAGSLAIWLANLATANVISVISPFYAARTLTHPLTSILPRFMPSSRNETSSTSSDGVCTSVVVFNRGVEFAPLRVTMNRKDFS